MGFVSRLKRCAIAGATVFTLAIAALPSASAQSGAEAAESTVTFSNQVVRIFQESCQQCHRPGQGAPMSLLTYKEARPWATSIKKKVQNREMPPWHADPRYGEFVNDRSLSDEEIEMIVRWVDSGSPRGNPADMPEPRSFPEGWSIGEPDLVLSMDRPYTVRASGRDTFEYFNIETRLLEDRYISAVEILPGDARVVHHVMAYIHQNDDFNFRDENSWANTIGRGGTMLIEYAVGNKGDIFPPGSGRLLKKGSRLLLQIHYHPYGKQTRDLTRVGLRFHPRGTEHRRIITRWVGTMNLRIPPNTKDVASRSSHIFRRAVNIISFQPHMHCRGQAMNFEVFYPDGQHEILCAVPNYDFNWQTTYIFTSPPYLPAGTRMEVTGYHDNTKDNPNNPNPNAYVHWGQATYDEMMHGWTDFVYAEDEGVWPTSRRTDAPVIAREEQSADTSVVELAKIEMAAPASATEPTFATIGTPLRHRADQPEHRESDVRTKNGGIPSLAILGLACAILGVGLSIVLLRRRA